MSDWPADYLSVVDAADDDVFLHDLDNQIDGIAFINKFSNLYRPIDEPMPIPVIITCKAKSAKRRHRQPVRERTLVNVCIVRPTNLSGTMPLS